MPRKSKKATFKSVPSTSHQNEQLYMTRDIASSSKCEERLQTSFSTEENANTSITVHKCQTDKIFFLNKSKIKLQFLLSSAVILSTFDQQL